MDSPSTDPVERGYGIFERIDDRGGRALMGANALIGGEVYNPAGDELGEITEIVLDLHCGKIVYAVLSYRSFLGIGEKLFAVPWKALMIDVPNKRYTLDATQEYLREAPGFDKDRWPNMADPSWAVGVHDFYGTVYD